MAQSTPDNIELSGIQKDATPPETPSSNTAIAPENGFPIPSSTGIKSVFETLRKHAVNTPFASCLENRKTKAFLVEDSNPQNKRGRSKRLDIEGLMKIDSSKWSHTGVLIVEDIDEKWCDALRSKYSHSLDLPFLLCHIVRAGDMGAQHDEDSLESYKESYKAFQHNVEKELARTPPSLIRNDQLAIHLDLEAMETFADSVRDTRVSGQTSAPYRIELLRKFKGKETGAHNDSDLYWKSSTRMSFCPLTSKLYIALVDKRWNYADVEGDPDIMLAAPGSGPVNRVWLDPYMLLPPDGYGFHEKQAQVINIASALGMLFHYYTVHSILTPPISQDPNGHTLNLITRMLAVSSWQSTVNYLEAKAMQVRRRTAGPDNERNFQELISLRRQLADAYQLFVTTSQAVLDAVIAKAGSEDHLPSCRRKAKTQRKVRFVYRDHCVFAFRRLPSSASSQHTADDSSSSLRKGSAGTAISSRLSQEADPRKLPETFADLDARFQTLMATLNDEIQIMIGFVQVEDAKSTMRQATLMAKQAGWTVSLAVLAAFYLPMTLATGIFGMNIKEITGDGKTNRYGVVITWAVAFVLTAGYVRASAVHMRRLDRNERKRKAAVDSVTSSSGQDQESDRSSDSESSNGKHQAMPEDVGLRQVLHSRFETIRRRFLYEDMAASLPPPANRR